MSKQRFTISTNLITKSPVFAEASREELRVLLALVELGEGTLCTDELSSVAGVSKARCMAAIALWEEAGVVTLRGADIPKEEEATISEEFEDALRLGDRLVTNSSSTATRIRDENLASTIAECARIMRRPALSTEEVKEIEALYSSLALSPEYIISLAAHLSKVSRKVTATTLSRKADELSKKGITTFEELDGYIGMVERENSTDKEIRRALSIRGRDLVPEELELFHKWSGDFGFSVEIIKTAYNKTVMATGTRSLPYMDALLTSWHGSGCVTVEDCLKKAEQFAAEYEQPKRGRKKKTEPEKPRYGNFDVEEAFERALKRSYGED